MPALSCVPGQLIRSPEEEHDLSMMENLSEASILRVLEERFKRDIIQVIMDNGHALNVK